MAHVTRGQNVRRTPNCISRGLFALKMRPKLALPTMRFGKSKFARFSRLNTSHRNSSCDEPRNVQVLASAKSTLAKPGPMTLLRGALPKVYGAGIVNAEVSNHRSGVRLRPPGSGRLSDRGAGPDQRRCWLDRRRG